MTAQQNRSQSETLAALPPPVRRRLRALKNLQLSVTNLEAEFYQEVHALEIKYMRLYYPSFNKVTNQPTHSYRIQSQLLSAHRLFILSNTSLVFVLLNGKKILTLVCREAIFSGCFKNA